MIEPIGLRSHLLIRICLDVGREEWFGMKMVPAMGTSPPQAGDIGKHLEERGQDAESRKKKPEDQRQDAEKRGKNPEGRGQDVERKKKKPEDQRQNAEKRGKNLEDWGQDAGRRGKNLEGRGQNAEQNFGVKKRHYGFLLGVLSIFGSREQKAEKEIRKVKERERAYWLQERQKAISRAEEDMGKLLSDILGMIGSWEGCSCVYEDGVYNALVGRKKTCLAESNFAEPCPVEPCPGESCPVEPGSAEAYLVEPYPANSCPVESGTQEVILPDLWGKCFRIREFDAYTRRLWVEELLPEAVLPHFVILGTAPCLPVLIEEYADRMKSLRWILPENECGQELQDFVEDFYTEYGLAITLQVMPAGQPRLQAMCAEPSNVLDFTREVRMNLAKVAQGSIWLDMLSLEEKKRRIVNCGTGISYISLKEKWKQVRKKEPFVL